MLIQRKIEEGGCCAPALSREDKLKMKIVLVRGSNIYIETYFC